MSENLFFEQMEENTKFNLFFPFHLNPEKLIGNYEYDPKYGNSLHCHYYSDVLHVAHIEPLAFYFTEEDRKYYSEQEALFIEKIQAVEAKKISKGYQTLTLELEEDTIEFFNQYRADKNLTIEEAIVDILTQLTEQYKGKLTERKKENENQDWFCYK